MHSRIANLTIVVSLILMYQLNAQQREFVEGPYFAVHEGLDLEHFPLLKTNADVIISGAIADIRVTQVYTNRGNQPIEAVYVFPASTRAALYHMEMKIGDRVLTAEIQEKGKARQTYENAKEEGKRASLLEQHRPNVFQMNVANIMPGDQIEIDLRYTEFLIPEDQKYAFVYPTVVGPRYTGEDQKMASAGFTHTPYQPAVQKSSYDFDIQVKLKMGIPIAEIQSSTHRVNIEYEDLDKATVQLANDGKKHGDKDYILEYSLAGNEIQSGVLTFENGDENFFLVQLEAPELSSAPIMAPREYIFVLDVSGSMKGFPLDVSKELMKNLLTGLRTTDQFNIMFFAGSAYSLSDQSLNATADNIKRAFHIFNHMSGGGGTNMLNALKKSLALPKADGKSRSFIIITDGYISVEEEAFQLIGERLEDANFFAFGIGKSVNRHLIEGIAHAGRAEPFIVTNEKDAYKAAAKLKSYIEYPVMTDICLSYNGVTVYDLQPRSIPDLMARRPIFVFGKYQKGRNGSITVTGTTGDEIYRKNVNLSVPNTDTKALSYLWAREKIRYLDDFNTIRVNQARIDAITALGLKYNLLTKYTSFVAVDDIPVRDDDLTIRRVKQSLPMPEGVSNAAIGFEMELEEVVADMKKGKTILVDVFADDPTVKILVEAVMATFVNQIDGMDVLNYLVKNEVTISLKDSEIILLTQNRLPDVLRKSLLDLLKKAQLENVLNGVVRIQIN